MNEKEEKAFKGVYDFYARWRETVIETQEQWNAFAFDAGKTCEEIDAKHCKLGMNLLMAAVDTIGELYMNGQKPLPANYFGREDI